MIIRPFCCRYRAAAILFSAMLFATPGRAANWLLLQGTEPAGAAPRAKLWGFVQPEFQQTDGTALAAGPWKGQAAIFNRIGPDLKSETTFQIRRARIGVRGTGMPLDGKVNYFVLAEMGNNGITRQGGGSVRLTDASITLNHIPGARIRIGQFKYPGSEEGLQAIHVFDYINFTNASNILLLERFFDGDGSDKQDPNRPNGAIGAFRDVGIQLFDSFRRGPWEHSYAVMVGNGNGIDRADDDANKDLYLYWSSERIYGGKGPRRQGLKLSAWMQDGKRTLTKAGSGEYDRRRWGAGFTFRKNRWRAAGEYIAADGMIFNGSDGGAVPGAKNNAGTAVASFNVAPHGEADGWYLHAGYAVTPKWELDLRYDVLNRLTDSATGERKFETVTLGAQYFFNKKSRLIVNYERRDAEAPGVAASAPPNTILDGIDDRLSIQFLAIF